MNGAGVAVRLMAVVMLGVVLGGCARSPRIVCKVNGQMLKTAFTFAEFEQTLRKEHGDVQVETNALLRSRSVEVRFTPLDEQFILAEKVLILNTNIVGQAGGEVDPASFFCVEQE